MKQHEQLKALYIARAEEAAKHYGLEFNYEQKGIWLTFEGWYEAPSGARTLAVEVKARGWKNASDAFVAAATEWYKKQQREKGWVHRGYKPHPNEKRDEK